MIARLLWLALVAAPPATAEPADGYRQLLESYARGDRAEALAGLGRFSNDQLIHEYGELRAAAQCGDATSRAGRERCKEVVEPPRALLRAAVMLHWDADAAERPEPAGNEQRRACPGKQADLAGRYAALLARWPDSKDFGRRFFLAAALRCQWDFCLPDPALRWARDGLKLFPRDPLLLLAVGSALEETATVTDVKSAEGIAGLPSRQRAMVQEALSARHQRFREAQRALEEAVAADPGLTLARVRLGRVLFQLGESEAARTALEQAIAARPEAGHEYLARLFLGQVHEDSGRLEQAVAEYRLALALHPTAQAAGVALSHALHLAGEAEEARHVIAQALKLAGYRLKRDPHWEYLTSNALQVEKLFDELRRETLQ